MTNSSNNTYPQEWGAPVIIQRQSELDRKMNDGCEIGTIGKYVVKMSLADLKEIANKELRAYSEELEHENRELQYKLDKAVEALKFYAELDGNGIQLYGEMDSKALEFIDGDSQPFGTIAREALKSEQE